MGDALPFVVGTFLALGALSFVLLPLLSAAESAAPASRAPVRKPVRTSATPNEDGLAVAALREIEFDKATGKLSDTDYEELRTKYTALALEDLRRADDSAARSGSGGESRATSALLAGGADEGPPDEGVELDPVEAAVRAAQARRPKCPACGPRPESDSVYCSDCGGYLPGSCGSCGTEVTLPGARFCNHCGGALAAA